MKTDVINNQLTEFKTAMGAIGPWDLLSG